MNPHEKNTVSDLGESALIDRITKLVPHPPGPAAGPGDDCAVIDSYPTPHPHDLLTLLKTDAMVESIHYTPDTDARRIGWKAIMRLVSDFAAMGGKPDRFLVTLAISPATQLSWVDGLYQGIALALQWSNATLAGGETTAVPDGSASVISIAATGRVTRQHLTLRSTAKPGDAIFVTGHLGGSFQSGHHLDFHPRLAEAAWLVRHFKPTSMMDLSDGLAADLPKLAHASNTGFSIEPCAIPCRPGISLDHALDDGEDFELLFTLPPSQSGIIEDWNSAFPSTPLTRIGAMTEPSNGSPISGGWNHFSQATPMD